MVELVIALFILSLVAGMTTLAIQSLRLPRGGAIEIRMAAARSRAVRDGRPVELFLDSVPGVQGPAMIRFQPDGSVVGDLHDGR